MLGFWTELLLLRKKHRSLIHGVFKMLDWDNEQIYAYTRTEGSMQYLVVCSSSQNEVVWEAPVATGKVLLKNYPSAAGNEGIVLSLRPFEGRLYFLERD